MKRYSTVFACGLVCCVFSGAAYGGGYQLQEYSVTNLGRTFAGAGVVGDDYSAIAFNPAGMNLKGTGLQTGANFVAIRARARGKITNNSGETLKKSPHGRIQTNAFLPHAFGQVKVNDKLTVGGGVYVPFGLGTYYNDDWFGRTHSLDSKINVIDSAVAASYKLTDKLSIGASVMAEYVDAALSNYLENEGSNKSNLKADDWNVGYSLGLMYEPFEQTRFGITYRPKITHKLKGTHKLYGVSGDTSTKLVFPEHILISAYHKTGKFGLSAMARWTKWDHFDVLTISSQAYARYTTMKLGYAVNTLPDVNEKWRNVWMFGVGLDYDYDQNWTFRTGAAFDQGAVRDAKNRTARVPDSDRIILSCGLSYKVNKWQFDAAYAHMFWRSSHAKNYNEGAKATTLNAKYTVTTALFGLSAQYNF